MNTFYGYALGVMVLCFEGYGYEWLILVFLHSELDMFGSEPRPQFLLTGVWKESWRYLKVLVVY